MGGLLSSFGSKFAKPRLEIKNPKNLWETLKSIISYWHSNQHVYGTNLLIQPFMAKPSESPGRRAVTNGVYSQQQLESPGAQALKKEPLQRHRSVWRPLPGSTPRPSAVNISEVLSDAKLHAAHEGRSVAGMRNSH